MTEQTKLLLRILAFEGEMEADVLEDRSGMTTDELRAAAVEGLFEIWALNWGDGEPASLKLTTRGYQVARELLRSEASHKS